MSSRRLVQLHHVDLWDDGWRRGLGAAYLIAYARSIPSVADRYDLSAITWQSGGPPAESVRTPRADEIAAHILASEAWMAGFTLTPWSEKLFLKAIGLVKRERPEVVVVVGGPMVTDSGPDLVAGREVDWLVRGYGEKAFAALLEALVSDSDTPLITDIPGVYGRATTGWHGRPPDGSGATVLSEVPSVFRQGLVELTDRDKLHVEWSRGCPVACTYCSWGMGNQRLVLAPHERMVDDLRFARERGIAEVVLNCSAINFSTAKLRGYVEAIREGDPGGELSFTAFVMYETLKPEQLELLRQVRFESLCMGLQTDEDGGRAVVGRPAFERRRFEWAVREIGTFSRPGVSIISGIPGDTLEKFRARLGYLVDTLDADITVFPLQLPPGTTMWQRRAELGIEPDAKRQHWVYETPTLSAADHLACVELAEGRLAQGRARAGDVERHSHGVSASGDFLAGLRERLRGDKSLVSLHDTQVQDGGTKVGLGVPFLISHARRRPVVAESYELAHHCWPLGYAQTATEELVSQIVNVVVAEAPLVVGMSLQAWSHSLFVEALRRIKRRCPDVVTVVGGPTASDLSAELLEQVPEIDYVFCGYAEHAFADFLEALVGEAIASEAIATIAGVCYRDARGVATSSGITAPHLEVLDPCGAPLQDGLVPALAEQCLLNVEWTRGCPLSCSFCSWAMGQRRLSRFSPDYVARDIACALDAGFEQVLICDPAINFSTRALAQLVDTIERSDPARRIGFHAFLQYPCLDAAQAQLLERVRFDRLIVGLQTDDPAGLAALKRPRFHREHFERALDWTRRACQPTVDLMTGVPGDSADKIRRRVDYVLGLDARISIFPMLALPGSDVWRRRQEHQLNVDERRMHLVRSLPTLSEEEYRRVVEELQRRSDDGEAIEVAGFTLLLANGGERAASETRAASVKTRPTNGEQAGAWVEQVLRRFAGLPPTTRARLGLSGWTACKLTWVSHADCRAVRIAFAGNERELCIDAFDARMIDYPRTRGERLAFLTADDAPEADVLCRLLARLDCAGMAPAGEGAKPEDLIQEVGS